MTTHNGMATIITIKHINVQYHTFENIQLLQILDDVYRQHCGTLVPLDTERGDMHIIPEHGNFEHMNLIHFFLL